MSAGEGLDRDGNTETRSTSGRKGTVLCRGVTSAVASSGASIRGASILGRSMRGTSRSYRPTLVPNVRLVRKNTADESVPT